jgi:hypothetical protein
MANIFHTTYLRIAHIPFSGIVLWLAWLTLIGLLFAYMYFISMTVVQVALRQELLLSIRMEEARVTELESQYFAHLDTLRPEALAEYNLVALTPSAYVTIEAGGRLTRLP